MYDVKHEVTKSVFTIKYKDFIDGVWNGELAEANILSKDSYNAIAQLYKSLSNSHEIEIVSITDAFTKSNSDSLVLGRTYKTLDGLEVKMMKVHNPGTDFETMSDQFGIGRYSRRAGCIGRCTASKNDDPMNIKIGCSWISKDFDHQAYDAKRGFNFSESEDKLTDFVDHYKDGSYVTMNYRGYVIGAKNGEWFFCKPEDIDYKKPTRNNSTARMWIDLLLDRDDAIWGEDEINTRELKDE